MIRLGKTETGFESLTCKFIALDVDIPFTLPVMGAVQRDMAPSRYYTNLVVLHAYYTVAELAEIHGATNYLEPARVVIPVISVEYLYSDHGTRLELEAVLNATELGQWVYSSYWRIPMFLESSSEIYDCSLLGLNILTIIVCQIVFICQQRRLVHIQAMILFLQTRRVPQVAGLEFLRLLSTTTPTEAPGKSQTELIVEFGNTYWLILFGLFLVLSGFYIAWELCLQWCPRKVWKHVTCSSLVLHIFDGKYGIYVRLLEVEGVNSQLVITSLGIMDNLVFVGYIVSVMTFTWDMSVQNNISGVVTCPGPTARVTWRQAWRFR